MGEGNGTPLQYSCLENPMDGGAWWAAAHGVAKTRTRLSNFTFTFHFHALEKEMATHSSVLAWRIPGTGEPGGLPSMRSHRVGHDWSDLAEAGRFWLVYSLSGISGHPGLSALKDVGCVWPCCCRGVMEWKQSTLEHRNPRIISWRPPECCSNRMASPNVTKDGAISEDTVSAGYIRALPHLSRYLGYICSIVIGSTFVCQGFWFKKRMKHWSTVTNILLIS